MEKTKLFRLACILMLIVGTLGLITAGSQLLYLTELSIGYTEEIEIVDAATAENVSFAVIFALIGAVLRLASGIVGLRVTDSRGKFKACLVLCLLIMAITLVVKLVDLVVVFNLSAAIGVLVSLLIPGLYLIGLLQSREK